MQDRNLTNTNQNYLDLLPRELKLYLLSLLDGNALLNFSGTCKQYGLLCNDLWKPRLRDEFYIDPSKIEKPRNYYSQLTAEKKKVIYHGAMLAIRMEVQKLNPGEKNNVFFKSFKSKKFTFEEIIKKYSVNEDRISYFLNLFQKALNLLLAINNSRGLDKNLIHTFVATCNKRCLIPMVINDFKTIFGESVYENEEHCTVLSDAMLTTLTSICALGLKGLYNIFLNKSPDIVHASFPNTFSLLHSAVFGMRYEIIADLIEKGADVNKRSLLMPYFERDEVYKGEFISLTAPSPLFLTLGIISQCEEIKNLENEKSIVELLLSKGANNRHSAFLNQDGDPDCASLSSAILNKTKNEAIQEICELVITHKKELTHSGRCTII